MIIKTCIFPDGSVVQDVAYIEKEHHKIRAFVFANKIKQSEYYTWLHTIINGCPEYKKRLDSVSVFGIES